LSTRATETQTTVAGYEHRFVPLGFDVLIAGIFGPFGGMRKLREVTLDRLDLRAGMRVLELAPSVADVITNGFTADLTTANLDVFHHTELARGTAQLWLAKPS
jgi:hypothetical protein